MNDARTQLRLERSTCAACGAAESIAELEGIDRELGLDGTFTVVRCASCGHHRMDPAPSEGQEDVLYPPDYAPFSLEPRRGEPGPARRIMRRISRWQQLGLARPLPGRCALELGCGAGKFLAELRGRGIEVVGIEPSTAAARTAIEAHGLNVLVGTDRRLDELSVGQFDLLVANMVLEHMTDPNLTLRRLARVATDQALLVISVPNFASASRRRFQSDWYALQVPRHVQHYDPISITRILEHNGWLVRRLWQQPRTVDTWKSLLIRHRAGPIHRLAVVGLRISPLIDVVLAPALLVFGRIRGASRMTIHAVRQR